jgi:hypothetical protein
MCFHEKDKPRAAETKGQQNDYFKLKNLIFCTQQILSDWEK